MNNHRKNSSKRSQRLTIEKSDDLPLKSLTDTSISNFPLKSFRLSPIPFSITSLDNSKFLEVSDSFLDVFGFNRDETIGSTASELGLYQQPNEDGLDFNIFRERKPLNQITVRLKTKAGEERLCKLTTDIISLNNCQCVLCFYEILSNHNKALEALQESEEKYRLLIEKSIDAVYIIIDNRFEFVNRKFIEMFGWSEKEICSPDFDMMCLVAPSSMSFMENRLNQIERGEKVPDYYEYTAISKDGKGIHVEVSLSYLSYNGKKAVQGIYHDITERKKAEKELIKFKTCADKANYGIAISDPYGNISYINEYFAGTHGYTSAEITGKSLAMFHNEEQLVDVLKINKDLFKTGSYTNIEVWHTHKDGHVFPMLMNGVVVIDNNQKPLYFAATAIDITEIKQTEKIVSAQHDLSVALSAVSNLNEALNLCLEYITKISDMKSCGIYLVTENQGLSLFAHRGLSDEFVKLAGYYEPDSPQVRLVMAGKPIYSLFSSLNLPFTDALYKEQLKYIAIIPLVYKGKIIACFNVSSRVHRDMPNSVRKTLETVAAQVGSAIIRLKIGDELHKLEEQYRIVVENANEAIIVFQDNVLKYVNPRTYEYSGYSKAELFSSKFIDFIHPDDRKIILENFAKRVKGMDKPLRYSFRFIHKTGDIRWLETSTTLITWEGRPASLAFINDITEEKIAEQQLQNEREFISSLLDTANSLIVCLDNEARIIIFNKEVEKLTGYKREDVIGKYWPEIFLPESHHHHKLTDFVSWVKKHPRDKYEGPLLTKSGEIKTILWSNSAIFHSGPDELTAIAVGQDITERKQIEEALRENEHRYELATAAAKVGVWDWNLQTGKFYLDPKIKALLGYTDDEIPNDIDVWSKYIYQEDMEAVMEAAQAHIDGLTPEYTIEHRMMHKDGSIRWINARGKVICDDKGKAIRMIGTDTDITSRKQAEETLKTSEEKYRMLIENAGEPIFSISWDGVYLTMNNIAASYLGGKPDYFIGKTMWELFPKEIADSQIKTIRESISSGKKIITTKSTIIQGQEKWFITNIQPINSSNDAAASVLIISSDITKLKLREFRERAVIKLLDNLRQVKNIDECFSFGCQSIYDAKLYKRSVLTMHNIKKEIIYLGHFGLDKNTVKVVRNNTGPSDEITYKITQDKYRINHSYFIPVESGLLAEYTERTIPQEEGIANHKSAWKKGDEFFIPILNPPKKPEGWLSVDTPFNSKRPSIDEAAFLEEIVDIVIKKVHEIQSLNLLKTERQALQEKNIALREVLAHIEEEKMEIKNQVRNEIDSTLIPAMNKMINADGTVNKTFYGIVNNCLRTLAESPGGFQHIYSKLSPREVEICNLVKNGAISKDIASALNISLSTVQKHREIIRKKLGITNKSINLATYIQK